MIEESPFQETLSRLMRHARWSNARSLASLKQLMPAPPQNTVQLFAHVVTTEQLYLARMHGKDPFPQEFWPSLTLDQAATVAREVGDLLVAFVAERNESTLRKRVRYRNSQGIYFDTPLDQMLVHLALHGEHHRGQIARIVREAGGVMKMAFGSSRRSSRPWVTLSIRSASAAVFI